MSKGAGEPPVLVIGDVHGHVDRLQALLDKAKPSERGAKVIQLGDLGHFGGSSGSPTGDLMSWQLAREGLIDVVLYGNHDRAVIDAKHAFGGFVQPDGTILHMIKMMEHEGRLLMAYEAHGWLLTHAGLHKQFRHQPVRLDKGNAREIADWLNTRSHLSAATPTIDAIGPRRGGGSTFGGILWRDISEKLYEAVPQVFGHSASPHHVVRGQENRWYCIDIGGRGGPTDPDAECLAGIWLPSQEIVRVDLHKE